MRKLIMMLASAVVFCVTLTGFGETVTNVRGSQRPNANLVDIYYDLNASDGGTYTVEVAIEGRTDTVTATTFSGDLGTGIAPGKNRHIVWEAGADWRGRKDDVKVVVTATKEDAGKAKKVQLWEGGPYWADRNIGADAPWEAGFYFWWGDIIGYKRMGNAWVASDGSSSNFSFSNENAPTHLKTPDVLQSEGWITAGVLAPSHDAAHVKWGGGWRMPTKSEFDVLINVCEWTLTTKSGIRGFLVRGRGAHSSNSIFLPCVDFGHETSLVRHAYASGTYWSSVPYSNSNSRGGYAWYLGIGDATGDAGAGTGYRAVLRCSGVSIRPVQGISHGTYGASGSSEWFFVDTTVGTLKIADVRSKYFDGEYGGGVGRKATFLSGVSCDIEMTILDDPVNVDHWLVNGREVTTRRFTFDVGTLPVGGRLEVVAVGKNDGVRSKPFRANFDIAEHVDEEHAGLWVARPSNSEGIDEIRYTPIGSGSFTFPLAPEKSGAKPSKLNWLPGDEWSICPKIELKLEVRSSGNGSCTFGTAGLEVGTSGSEGTASHKRNRRAVGKFARVMDKDVGITFTGGPLTMSWNAQKKKWVAEDVSFGGEVSGSLGVTHHYPTPIGPVFYEIKGEAALAGIFRVSGLDFALGGLGWGGLETSFSISSDRLPKVSVGGGYGINHIACLKGTVSGMSVLDATYSNGEWHDFRWGLRGSGAVTATFLIFDGKLFELTSDTLWIYNNTSPKSMRLMSSAQSSDIEWELQSRDYLKKGTQRMRLMATAPTDGVVESGGYPNPAPAMASGAVCDALAYLRDNAERTSANRTELVLRMGTSNEWDAAEVVWNDGTADFMPEIAAMPDGSFVATWANTGRTFSDDVTLPEMCGAMEIAVGVRNAATGAWSCRNLTADSVLDFAPVVRAGTNGTALVAWLRNAAGSLVGSAAEPTDIMASVYANGTWSAPAAVVAGAGSVGGFDVAFDGENAVLAFSKDADGNQETMGDTEIFAVRFNGAAWGEPARLTYAGDSDGQPFVRGGAGTGFAVLWTEKGTLMETTELAVSNAVAVAAADGWMLSGGCSVMRGADGRDALVWGGDSAAGGAANAPVAMMYDPVCGAWGAPRKLLDDGRYERQLTGAVGADGGIRIGYESSSVSTNAEGEVIFGDVELRTRFIPATCDLAVVEDGFSFASEDLADGEETVLTVKVENLGFRTATNATVTVYEGAGDEKSELANVVTNFPGGGIVAVNVPWTVDNTRSNLQFTVEIDAGGNEDAGADSNNVYIWNAGAYDVSFAGVVVRNESATRRLLTAAVSNAGLGPLPKGGKVVFRRGGENGDVLAVDEIGTVWPGTNGVYNAGFAWDIEGVTFTSAWETVCVQLFPDGVTGSALDAADMAFVQVMTTYREPVFRIDDGVLTAVDLNGFTDVVIPDGVTTIADGVFSNCVDLASVTIPGSVTNVGKNAFFGCDSMREVHAPDIAAWCGITFGNAYGNPVYYAKELCVGNEAATDIVIPNGVTDIGYCAFVGCTNITNVVMPDSVTGVGGGAFYNCSGLTSVTIGSGVKSIGQNAFRECSSLENVTLKDGVTDIGYGAFVYCSNLVSVAIPGSVTNIGEYAFRDCSNLKSVTLKDGVTDIGYGAFMGCTNITNVVMPDSVTGVGGVAFYNCSGLTNVTIGSGVKSIGQYAFRECSSLENVTLKDGVMDIGYGAFVCCSNLVSVAIPGSVTNIGEYAFRDCSNLKSVTVPDGMENIGYGAFAFCRGLSRVAFQGRVTRIGEYVFYECLNLMEVHVADLAAWCNVKFGKSYGNPTWWAKSLYLDDNPVTSLIIPDGVTAISDSAFISCTNIASVTVPASVTNVDHLAFAICDSLAGVIFLGDAPTMGSQPFFGVPTGCTAYVRRSTAGWAEWDYLPIVYIEDAEGGIPSVGEDVPMAVVNAAIDIAGFADAEAVKKTIGGSAEKYNAFRKWAQGVGGGEQAVIASPRAAMSYALGADMLIGKEITSNDVHVAGFGVAGDGGGAVATQFAFEVAIDGVNIGGGAVNEAALKENLKKVLGVEGSATLSPGAFSSDNINIVFDAPANGKAKFTVTPPADAGNAYFMRVKVK